MQTEYFYGSQKMYLCFNSKHETNAEKLIWKRHKGKKYFFFILNLNTQTVWISLKFQKIGYWFWQLKYLWKKLSLNVDLQNCVYILKLDDGRRSERVVKPQEAKGSNHEDNWKWEKWTKRSDASAWAIRIARSDLTNEIKQEVRKTAGLAF